MSQIHGCGCGCGGGCRGAAATHPPAPGYHRPGLPALSYRTGTHGTFRAAMLARLASRAPLRPLTTREPGDPAIALLDCWALAGDVLTFYQERIANEGYLRTATEPESLRLLGALVGYQPRPPLAATTHLSFTLDPGARSVIPAGTGARSVPDEGGLPHTFETTEDLVARAEWNTLEVRAADPPAITPQTAATTLRRLDVAGTAAALKTGDRLLFVFGAPGTGHDPVARIVESAEPDFTAGRTTVTLVAATTEPGELDAAIDALAAAIAAARAPGTLPPHPAAAALDAARLAPLHAALTADPPPDADDVLGYPIAGHLARLPEEQALARTRAGCALSRWLDGELGAVRVTGEALTALAARLARRALPELDELTGLAERLVCGPPSACPPRPPDADCAQAAALVGMTPIVPALRRAPARPPRAARDLAPRTEDLFRADSDAHPRLLIAADPRLAPALHDAWAAQRIAPPPPLSGVRVPRVKAQVTGLGQETSPPSPTDIRLDAVYDAIQPGGLIIVESVDTEGGVTTEQGVVTAVWEATMPVTIPDPDGGEQPREVGTVPVTWLRVTGPGLFREGIATRTVWAGGEELTPLGEPLTGDVGGDEIELGRAYDGLLPGRWLVVTGERTDVPHTSGVSGAELAMAAGVRQRVDPARGGDTVRTTLLLASPLAFTYRRDTVTLHGNVAAATQGETRQEVLGSGDAGQPGQSFPLRQVLPETPLTWTPATTPLGAESALTTRVGGVAWQLTGSLDLAGPTDHAYELRTPDDGGAHVHFGDGAHGARLPSGTENVTATYRTGAGRSGNVAAGRVTQLAARPLGVSAVTNPLPATGGADGDGAGDARATIPLRMLALDRLVSVPDYAGFTRARAGIGKASAAKLTGGGRETVHVTIAGTGDVPIDPLSGLFTSLEESLTAFGGLGVPVTVAVRERVLLVLNAGIKMLPGHAWELVEPAVRAALLAEFGFAARELGQPAYLSQAIAAIHRVPGVDHADIDVFHGIPGDITPIQLATLSGDLTGAAACVPAAPARFEERRHPVDPHDTLTLVAHRHGLTLDELVALNPALPGVQLTGGSELVVFRGIRPAQLAVLPDGVPEALTLRRIP